MSRSGALAKEAAFIPLLQESSTSTFLYATNVDTS